MHIDPTKFHSRLLKFRKYLRATGLMQLQGQQSNKVIEKQVGVGAECGCDKFILNTLPMREPWHEVHALHHAVYIMQSTCSRLQTAS